MFAEKLPFHIPLPSRVVVRERSSEDERIEATLVRELGIHPVTARVLCARGVVDAVSAQAFLSPTLREHLPNPEQMLNLVAAAEALLDAIEARTSMVVVSDFDVDGLSSAAQLVPYLRALGARVQHYTPNRFREGYGLSMPVVEKVIETGAGMLVTLDCGITNHAEIAHAKEHGLQVVVLDHHVPHGIPPADVVVDPAQEGCPFGPFQLCAAGIVWMLLIVLRSTALRRGVTEAPDPKSFLDLASLGTICDMVPLTGVNRLIALRGLEALSRSEKPGVQALLKAAGVFGKKVSAGNVGFGIGPRINAAGRLEDASVVFELLTTGDSKRAERAATMLNRFNRERQAIEEEVKQACLGRIQDDPSLANRGAFALCGADFHPGVLGIVAQRLVEHFYKPAAVMTQSETTIGGVTKRVRKGSVRSIRGFHVAEALQALDDMLMQHGGHAAAGGFTVAEENGDAFQEAFIELAERMVPEDQRQRTRTADASVKLGELTYVVVHELAELAPFGIGNPAPLLLIERATVQSVQSIGNGHLRLKLRDGDASVGAVAWRLQGHPSLVKGADIGIAFQPELNSYGGITSVQLNIKEAWTS